MWYIFWKSVAAIICYPIFRIKTIGRENLPTDRGYMISPNHVFALDPVFVVLSYLSFKKVMILGKEELFKNKIIGAFLKTLGAVPIHRGSGDMKPIETIIKKVEDGHAALVFPEGTRSKTGELGKLKSGAFVIAAQANTDIVPCRIIYKKCKFFPIPRCYIYYGEPILASELNLSGEKSSANLRRCKEVLKERILALGEE